jgi:hypothetical protein
MGKENWIDDVTGNVTVEKRGSHMGKGGKGSSYMCKGVGLDFNVKAVKRVEGAKRPLTRMAKGAGIDDVTHEEKGVHT